MNPSPSIGLLMSSSSSSATPAKRPANKGVEDELMRRKKYETLGLSAPPLQNLGEVTGLAASIPEGKRSSYGQPSVTEQQAAGTKSLFAASQKAARSQQDFEEQKSAASRKNDQMQKINQLADDLANAKKKAISTMNPISQNIANIRVQKLEIDLQRMKERYGVQ